MSIDAVMDLYGNQTPQFTAQFGVQGPRIISNSVAQAKPGIDRIRVTFNESMDPLTFTADKIATFTGPAGPIMVTDVVAVPGTNNTEFDISFDALTAPGSYTMVIGPDIRDPFGNPMDQNNNLIPGETPGDQFTYHLTIRTAGPGGGARPPDATEDAGHTLAGFLSDRGIKPADAVLERGMCLDQPLPAATGSKEHMTGNIGGRSFHAATDLVLREDDERLAQPVGIARELHRRSVGQEFSLPVDG
jgi:Bacterial Ig-like domain